MIIYGKPEQGVKAMHTQPVSAFAKAYQCFTVPSVNGATSICLLILILSLQG